MPSVNGLLVIGAAVRGLGKMGGGLCRYPLMRYWITPSDGYLCAIPPVLGGGLILLIDRIAVAGVTGVPPVSLLAPSFDDDENSCSWRRTACRRF